MDLSLSSRSMAEIAPSGTALKLLWQLVTSVLLQGRMDIGAVTYRG